MTELVVIDSNFLQRDFHNQFIVNTTGQWKTVISASFTSIGQKTETSF